MASLLCTIRNDSLGSIRNNEGIEMKELIIFALAVALAWAAYPVYATDQIGPSVSSSSTSASNSTATAAGGPGGAAGAITNRAIGIGLGASANTRGCLAPWLGGLLLWPESGCVRDRDIQMLHGLGMHDAAIQRACQDPEMWFSIAASADKARCKTQPAWVTQ